MVGRGRGKGAAPVVLVVAKSPVPGTVKTRLCPPATPTEAAHVAAAALLDTLQAVAGVSATTVIGLAGEVGLAARGGELRRALRGWTVFGQRGRTFADRLAAAHAEVAARFPGRPVLQLGLDTPQLSPALLSRCLDRLAGTRYALLGPTADGGWWALGLPDPRLAAALTGVPMSRPDTGERTRRELRRRGLRVRGLPRLTDVDTMVDALRVATLVPDSRFAAAVAAVTEGPLTAIIPGTATAGPSPEEIGEGARSSS